MAIRITREEYERNCEASERANRLWIRFFLDRVEAASEVAVRNGRLGQKLSFSEAQRQSFQYFFEWPEPCSQLGGLSLAKPPRFLCIRPPIVSFTEEEDLEPLEYCDLFTIVSAGIVWIGSVETPELAESGRELQKMLHSGPDKWWWDEDAQEWASLDPLDIAPDGSIPVASPWPGNLTDELIEEGLQKVLRHLTRNLAGLPVDWLVIDPV